MTSAGDGAGMIGESDPFAAFQRIFGDLSAGDTQAIIRQRAQRKSVLDLVRAELADLRCDLGTEERPKFDLHVDAVREIEKGLDARGAGEFCAAPSIGASFDVRNRANLPQITKAQLDNAVAAFACDLTRVITLQFETAGNADHTWVGTRGPHDIAHGNFPLSPAEQHDWGATIDTWYASQFAYIVGKLDSIPEGAGTMLDNTLCVWTHEQSNASAHQRTDPMFSTKEKVINQEGYKMTYPNIL